MQTENKVEGRKRKRIPRLQLVAFVVLVLVACFAFAQKVGAQGGAAPRATGGAGRGGAMAKLKPGEKAGAEKAAAAAAPIADAGATEEAGAPAAAEPPAKRAPEDEDLADQLATAKAGPDGGVPVHSEGEYRSPFAYPKRTRANARVGFLVETIEDYDIKKGAFTAHFFVSLTSDKPMPKIDLRPTNGKVDAQELLADLPTFKMWKIVGTFTNKPDLHAYPFDTQELTIELEDDSNGLDVLKLVPDVDHTYLDSDFSIAGWDVSYIRARVMNHYYPDRFDNDDLYYSRYKVGVGIKRFATSAVFTVFVPALVIVLISLSGLWFPRDELEVRSNATTPMLAAAVLFHFALMQELPATAYLSRADKLMMGVYMSLGMHMATSWVWFVVHEKHTEFIFKWAKRICAPATFIMMAVAMFS
ncbi:MAG: hypothetical protein KC657_16090 [Myxococcales bacterium]|nr:hypothetical protein [Myxococcales bacterium]